MRIRKNAKLSPLLFSHGGINGGSSVPVEAFQTHVCQLNQSPWDVIPFASDSFQFEGEDSFTGNGSTGDSIGAVESVASMMDADTKSLPKLVDMAVDNNENNRREEQTDDDNGGRELEGKISWCQKSDGKGWHCKSEAIEGQSFCERHLNYSSSSSRYKKAAAAAAAAAAAVARRAARARANKKSSSSSSNPYEFYYYSGFGPLWGKRRSNRNGIESGNAKNNETKEVENSTITEVNNESENAAMDVVDEVAAATTTSSSSQIDNEEFDYVEDDDEEDEDEEEANNGDDNGKKRMRKPVKARSLKSLM